jgi:hypothetical protein
MAVLVMARPAWSDEKEHAQAFKEFAKRVNAYVSLHKTVEGTLPALKTTDVPELIAGHQQALARKIRESRVQAREGDVFGPEGREAFRHVIRKTSDGARGPHARATMRQGDPLPPMKLRVNDVYPEKLPVTTVPPTILQALPKLPNEVEYRIVGRDLLLLDVRANMVVDLIHEAMPRHYGPNP